MVQDVPWAAERAYAQRPFADTTALREAFQDAVLTGSPEQQQELLKAFPDLGAEDETGQVLAVRPRGAVATSTRTTTTTSWSWPAAYRGALRLPADHLRQGDRALRPGAAQWVVADRQLRGRPRRPSR